MTRLTRFLRKPLREKAAAVRANLRFAGQTVKDWGRVYPWVIVEHLDFRSGLGDSSYLLHGLVRSMKPAVCVEIGSARGRSACFIGLALKENGRGKLIAIDPHKPTEWNDSDSVDTIEIIRNHLRYVGVEEQVEIRRQTSSEAAHGWSDRIDLIFIDGDHTYEGVKQDWDLFSPHLAEFGVAIFHDTMWEQPPYQDQARADMGVARFLDELREAGYPVITIDQDYGVSLVQAVPGSHRLGT